MQEKSLNSVRVFWLRQDELIRDLKKVAERIGREDRNVVKIVLFGSIARKKGVPGSDADILILLEKDRRHFLERMEDYRERFSSIRFPLDVFVYTLEEVENPIVKEAVDKGIVLFER